MNVWVNEFLTTSLQFVINVENLVTTIRTAKTMAVIYFLYSAKNAQKNTTTAAPLNAKKSSPFLSSSKKKYEKVSIREGRFLRREGQETYFSSLVIVKG